MTVNKFRRFFSSELLPNEVFHSLILVLQGCELVTDYFPLKIKISCETKRDFTRKIRNLAK
jgi:hypothetical protein